MFARSGNTRSVTPSKSKGGASCIAAPIGPAVTKRGCPVFSIGIFDLSAALGGRAAPALELTGTKALRALDHPRGELLDEAPVARVGHPREERLELVQRRAREAVGDLPGVLD